MGYITLGNTDDLQIEIPTQRTEDWAERVKDNFVIKVVEHDHTGNGKGRPLGSNSFADDSVSGVKFLLNNNEYLRSSGLTPASIVNILRVNTSDQIEFATVIANAEVVDLTITKIIGKSTLVEVGAPLTISLGGNAGGHLNYTASSTTGKQSGVIMINDVGDISQQYVGAILGVSITSSGGDITIDALDADTTYTFTQVVL